MENSKYCFWNLFNASFVFFYKEAKTLFKLMWPPILMQIAGIILSLVPAEYVTKVLKPEGAAVLVYIAPIIVCLVIGLIIYCTGFWKYLLLTYQTALAAKDYDEKKEVNFELYKNEILSRQGDFIKMLLWVASFGLAILLIGAIFFFYFIAAKNQGMAMLTVLILTAAIIWYSIKAALVTQVFAYEKNIEPKNVLFRSFALTKNRFLLVFGVMFVLGLISIAFQLLISLAFAPVIIITSLNPVLSNVISNFINFLGLFLLPLNISVCALLYKRLAV